MSQRVRCRATITHIMALKCDTWARRSGGTCPPLPRPSDIPCAVSALADKAPCRSAVTVARHPTPRKRDAAVDIHGTRRPSIQASESLPPLPYPCSTECCPYLSGQTWIAVRGADVHGSQSKPPASDFVDYGLTRKASTRPVRNLYPGRMSHPGHKAPVPETASQSPDCAQGRASTPHKESAGKTARDRRATLTRGNRGAGPGGKSAWPPPPPRSNC